MINLKCLLYLKEFTVYNRGVAVFAKIEAAESLKCLDDIIRVSDGAMVARGDLGAQIPLEQVPSVQEAIVAACRRLNKPVIVASQLLESMIEYPTPTRAEVRLGTSMANESQLSVVFYHLQFKFLAPSFCYACALLSISLL